MPDDGAVFISVIIVIILVIAAAYVWYYHTGWQSFNFKTGDSPSWSSSDGDVSKLRFDNSIFTVTRSDGVMRSQDVTEALNGMAVAYQNGTVAPGVLNLTGPLNPFSFVIPGFNDSQTVTDPTGPLWCTTGPKCSPSAIAMLAGKWRQI
jgi:hypothetical protein